MRCSLGAWAFVISAAVSAFGQPCPKPIDGGPDTPSEIRDLEGKLIFHNGIRPWFELKLDRPQCGQTSIQLNQVEQNGNPMEVFRGCHVRSRGAIDVRTTGYISLDMYQNAEVIESTGRCERQLPFPDYSKVRPDKGIGEYRVEVKFNYTRGDQPIIPRVTTIAGQQLHPWQVYANYFLTGVFFFYGHCAEGFVMGRISGTPEANPTHFDDPASPGDTVMFDPESAAAGKTHLNLSYTCVRDK